MKFHISLLSVLAAGVCALAGAASACWTDVPTEQLVKDSPTIVVGRIERIKVAAPTD